MPMLSLSCLRPLRMENALLPGVAMSCYSVSEVKQDLELQTRSAGESGRFQSGRGMG